MKTFEDELLTELRTVVAERAETDDPRQGRFGRVRSTRGRVVIGVAACVTLAAGAAVAVPVIGGKQTTSPAYSVTTNSVGEVIVEVYRPEGADGLERRLEAAGVDAEVNALPAGKTCHRTPAGQTVDHTPSGQPLPGSDFRVTWMVKEARAVDPELGEHGGTFVFDPKHYRGATVVVELAEGQPKTTREGGRANSYSMGVKYLKNGTFGPCVVVDR